MAGVDKLHINSFVASYYEVNQRGQGKLIKDFDKLTTVSERKAFLNKKGKLRKQNYTDQEINRMYHQYCRMRVSRELKNIGNNS